MHWEVVLTSFFLMLISSITICIGNRKLIGKEVMEIDDLMLFEEETNKVGNLDYGDPCRDQSAIDIADDPCFHSNPLLQCISGQCACGYIRLSETDVFQMKYQNGKCKRLEKWGCNSTEDCIEGLSCSTVSTTEDYGHPKARAFYQYKPKDKKIGPEQERELVSLESAKTFREVMKKKLRLMREKMNKLKKSSQPTSLTTTESIDVTSSEDPGEITTFLNSYQEMESGDEFTSSSEQTKTTDIFNTANSVTTDESSTTVTKFCLRSAATKRVHVYLVHACIALTLYLFNLVMTK